MARRVRRSRADNQRWNQMTAALRLMNFAFNNIRLYPPTHSEVVGVLTKLLETLTPILEEQEDLGFGFMDELLYRGRCVERRQQPDAGRPFQCRVNT